MNPQPITSGDSVVGYACGVCGTMHATARVGESEAEVARARDDAARCCVCAKCGAIDASIGAYCECAACSESTMRAVRLKLAENAAAQVVSFDGAALRHEAAWAIVLDDGRTGKVYLVDPENGFFDVYGRLDPTEYDTAPEVASETLRRNAGSAVADVVGALADRVDALVQCMEKVK